LVNQDRPSSVSSASVLINRNLSKPAEMATPRSARTPKRH
jgi:hypothetical protein